MWTKIKKIILVSRPVSWVNTAYPFAAAYLMTGGVMDARFVIATLFFLIPYNLVMYGVNDVFDYESDIKNPRKGGVEGMREERALHPSIIRWSIASAFPLLIAMLLTGTLLSNLVLVVIMFMVVAYSVAGLRFKEIPLLDSITSSTHFTGPLVYGFILTGAFHGAAIWIAVAMFLWGMASHAFGAVQDIAPDREGGLRSIATAFGAKNTVWLSIILYIAASLATISVGGLAVVAGLAGLVYVVNCLPYAAISDASSMNAHTGWQRFMWLNYVVGAIITMLLVVRLAFGA